MKLALFLRGKNLTQRISYLLSNPLFYGCYFPIWETGNIKKVINQKFVSDDELYNLKEDLITGWDLDIKTFNQVIRSLNNEFMANNEHIEVEYL